MLVWTPLERKRASTAFGRLASDYCPASAERHTVARGIRSPDNLGHMVEASMQMSPCHS